MAAIVPFPQPLTFLADPIRAMRAARHTAIQAEMVLGDALLRAYTSNLHLAFGHGSFAAFARAEAGVGRCKAHRLIREARARLVEEPSAALTKDRLMG